MPRIYQLLILLFPLSGCGLFEDDDMVPGLIRIERADIITDEALQGAATHNIVDVHVFANEDFVGSYELPATIAIRENGPTRLNINAGIRNSGSVSSRIIYPFYAPIVEEVDLIPGVVMPISSDSTGVFSYFPTGLNFFIEDFENVGSAISITPASNADLLPQSEVVRSGNASGKITLNDNEPFFQAVSQWEINNPERGSTVYLEIDFLGNNPLEIGLQRLGNDPVKIFVIGLNPQQEWTKVYVDMTQPLANFIGNEPFVVYFESTRLSNVAVAEMYIDNVKFVYPQ